MEEIIYQDKAKITREERRYAYAAEKLQQHVDELRAIGLTVTIGDLRDILEGGRALIEQTVKVTGFKLSPKALLDPAVKAAEIEAAEIAARRFLDPIVEKIKGTLHWNGALTLRLRAFEITKGVVRLSEEWRQELISENTIYATPERTEALKLCQDVKNAIDALNQFAKSKRMFKSGLGISGSTYRTLANINEYWAFEINLEEFNYI